MAKEVKLPQLGQTMEEGTIVNILIKEGDEVKKGDVLFEIETDKATLEMESPAEGFVKKILVSADETIPVGQLMVILGEKDEQLSPEHSASVSAGGEKPAETAAASAESVDAKVVKLPQLGQTMEEGTIVNILIKNDDKVAKGDVIFEVETDKATLEMESPAEGWVKKILVSEGETIPVNVPVLVLAGKDDQLPQSFIDSLVGTEAAPTPVEKAPAEKTAAPKPSSVETKPAPVTAGRIFASPRAKMVAQELGIDLSRVQPSNGLRIVEADVRAATAGGVAIGQATAPAALPQMPEPAYKLGQKVPLSKFQKITAQKMLQSKNQIPCFYLTVKVDATEMVKLRTNLNQTGSVKIAFNDFIIRAIGLGLKQFPEMTGQFKDDHIQLAEEIKIGLAISVGDELVAPLVGNADKENLIQVAQTSKAVIARAKDGKLGIEDIEGGCITVSSLGGFGIDSFIPIVVPGQTTILGVGKITDTCVPIDGNIMIRKLMDMTLSIDHKVANGANAAIFLDYVKKLLENPQALL
ncbi:MAG: 2-oxo acid dehydrogenase subunit E2 [Phycisphaerae bacterium]|nr:2-oxo acid dehydrogenase subunit E2 [Phycisphaerae bacterium]